MKLKSLELFGFKSFVDKTVIHFGDGITGIVGPNGCGKSNCVDAIRWAMGEQSAKHLRGAEMQDVIFNGTANRPPVGMSQVTLRFDTSDGRAPIGYADYSEIEVTRSLYRSGESEYSINKIPCRLRDIIDLFLGTGVGTKAYSIIEQGKIDRILSAKPEERRFIIEEAAGISKFKARKEGALRKMETTEANLARLKDIVAEIRRQLNSLNRQAKKAERYKQVFEELKERELRFSSFKYQNLQSELERLEADRAGFEGDQTQTGAKIAEEEAGIAKERLDLAQIEQALGEAQEKFYRAQNAVKLHEAALEYQASKLKDLARQLEENSIEVKVAQNKLQDLEKELENLNQTQLSSDLLAASVKERSEEVEGAAEEAARVCKEWQEKSEGANKAILECVGGVAETQSRLEYSEKSEVELEGRIAKGQAEIDAIDKVLKELGKKIARGSEALNALKQLGFKLGGETTNLKETLESKRKELSLAADQLENLKADLSAKESRHHSLTEIQKNMEGFEEGVRHVLQASQKDLRGIVGAVSDIVDTESEYEPAVSAVLGDKLQYVVVKSQREGLEAIDYLKTQTLGRSSFIPLDIAPPPTQSAEQTFSLHAGGGVVGPLLEKIRFNDEHKKIAKYLFGDCILVEDLRNALDLWQDGGRGKRLVTLQGEVLSPEGILSGGAGGHNQSLLGLKRKLEDLSGEVTSARVLVEETKKKVWQLKAEVQGLEERLESTSRDYHGEEIRFVQQEKDILRLKEEEARYSQDRDRLSLEIARALEEKTELGKEREKIVLSLEEKIEKQEEEEKNLAAFQTGFSQASSKKEALGKEVGEVKAKLTLVTEQAERTTKELEKGVTTKLELQSLVERRLADINANQEETISLEKRREAERVQLNEALKELEAFQQKQGILKESYETLAKGVQQRELAMREIRRRLEETTKALHAGELEIEKSKNQIQVLNDQMLERYKIDIGHYVCAIPDDFSAEAETQRIAQLKEAIEKIGSVHVGALDEFGELQQRYDFLAKQEADLQKSLDDLKKAIQKINRVSRERFLATFESVNTTFQEVFPKLFKGGRAKLLLVDEQNLLETGVEIVAQPPGKKLQSITLLSGGEKALTAVALIFSIFLIKPSPFCLLDEVDAPLDDANIDRFNDMVREMTKQSQFIVITHNKRTMERADTLYGVTMEEPGASKIVSVRLNTGAQEPLAEVA